jgi:ribonuclease HI
MDLQPWHELTSSRKIQIFQGDNILRWGHSSRGTFTIKEAYNIKTTSHLLPQEPVWEKIWSIKHWPKISTFLWLVAHKGILTWDNLTKRGFVGPSIFPLCWKDSESQNHLLNLCSYSTQIWDHCCLNHAHHRSQMRRPQGNLRRMERLIFSFSHPKPYMATTFRLHPLADLEREKQRIFLSSHLDWQKVWQHINDNIRETILLQPWKEEDLSCPPQEKCILDKWIINFHPHFSRKPQSSQAKGNPSHWSPPAPGFIKLNFDGASKGNPGPVGFRVVLRNSQGSIMLITADNIGHNTNNAVELWGLIKGLQLAQDNGHHKLIIEGDSQIILSLFAKILNGADPDNISPCWRLTTGLSAIATLISPHLVLIPSHVRRKSNQVADKLANIGVALEGPDILYTSPTHNDHPLLQDCIAKALSTDSPPDGVSERSTHPSENPESATSPRAT